MSTSQHSMHHQAGVVKLVSKALVQDMFRVWNWCGVQRHWFPGAYQISAYAEPSCRNQRIRSFSKALDLVELVCNQIDGG